MKNRMMEKKNSREAASAIIGNYSLKGHPEGGFYAETYRSSDIIPVHYLPEGFMGARNICTAILYLLEENDFSALHRIRQDEIWHFYLGGALRLVMISPEGVFSEILLGQNMASGEWVQYVVPAGYWFGAMPVKDAGFSLAGCTAAPGFDFEDCEHGKRADLLRQFPQHKAVILEFTRDKG